LKTSAIILAGGFSKRFGRDKGLIELNGKPLILHVLDKVAGVVKEIVVVVSSHAQKGRLQGVLGHRASVVVDKQEVQSPLIGAVTGFDHAQGEYSLLLPCDTPFLSSSVVQLLLKLCTKKAAVIPRWPNGYVEPLQAAYHTESALRSTRIVLKEGKRNLRSMIAHLNGVRYISTTVLKAWDPELLTFFNVNTADDLRKAEVILSKCC